MENKEEPQEGHFQFEGKKTTRQSEGSTQQQKNCSLLMSACLTVVLVVDTFSTLASSLEIAMRSSLDVVLLPKSSCDACAKLAKYSSLPSRAWSWILSAWDKVDNSTLGLADVCTIGNGKTEDSEEERRSNEL